MAEYFKLDIETLDYQDGITYIEFIDRVPTRQVTHVGERWLSSLREHDTAVGPLLTDQPLQPGEFDDSDRVSAAEFEDAWTLAITQERDQAMIEHRIGDLFTADDADALAHGCNCAGAMGRGIAVEFKRRWPQMYEEYKALCRAGKLTPGEIFPWQAGERWIYNLGTQAHWRTRAEMQAVVSSVDRMLAHAGAHGVRRIAMPRIAAGLGGLEWAHVEDALTPIVSAHGISVAVYQLP
ncbi:macro domain-containing protein [Streptomyces sp. QH1-20]|uniref:macro domain-containing protein n=1 Tax=Streptomyces sp. QH1-20 TaxID=3240934 RepID=UPI003512B31D